ncbi:MAG: NAD(P)-dependent glycerol-3-phosphate dehydrogenase [Deltaproteobacteria bacterium]|nr:NAD(P)-dependent glycerol-3-phosphate dehydrogenase [Deltaproteobacteria bacterium]MBI3295458.1 NAD(P)-dependent glycerol-3-phosphate dehydrogenase [Deltaproteobacteria bacterium]
MAQIENITVLGSGSFGTALANVLADNGHNVLLWGRDRGVIAAINGEHFNPKYLKGTPLNSNIKATAELSLAFTHSDTLICAIPAQKIRSVLTQHQAELPTKTIINTAKGIEVGTQLLVSEIFAQLSPKSPYAILSGPSFAAEVAQRLPTAITAASQTTGLAEKVQALFNNRYFRVYAGHDVRGVELAGSLKNVIAIGSGVVTGLKLGYNAQAAIINRGVAEMARLAQKMKADPMTFLGLAGMGDLVLTCTGPLSRNRTVGVLLGEGKPLADIEKQLGGVAEGVYTAESAYVLSQQLGVEMPITEQTYKILYQGQKCSKALEELMARDPKSEWA